MERADVEEMARQALDSGFNCAESVLHSAGLHLGVNVDGKLTRVASGFGGGVGRSKRELCGALAGGLMAIGLAFGRDSGGQSCEEAYDLAATFRERFLARHGACACHELLERFGPQRHWECCRRLTGETAGMLFELAAEARRESE